MTDSKPAETELVADERVFAFYSDIEQELRASVRAAVEQHCPLDAVARRFDTPDPAADRELWRVLGNSLGIAGLLVAEEYDGSAATAREAAVVLEEMGRGVVPAPFLTSAVWATALLTRIDATDGVQAPGLVAETLTALAINGDTACVAARADTVPGVFPAGVAGTRQEHGVRLDGAVASVMGARDAGILIVPASLDGQAALLLVDGGADGVLPATVTSLDESNPLTDLVFDDCRAVLLAAGPVAAAAFESALVTASALLASEQLGVAERCLAETVAYVKTRHQFGRTIGSFQVVKHRLADLWAQVEGARTAARYAATCAATGSDDLPVAAALAVACCGPAAVRAAEECVQLHGGIGFTWEHPAHLWLKRAMAQSVMFGGADGQRARLAALVDLPPA